MLLLYIYTAVQRIWKRIFVTNYNVFLVKTKLELVFLSEFASQIIAVIQNCLKFVCS